MRKIGEAMLREARPTRDMDILDYGCGTGLVCLYLLPHVRSVVGADNSQGMLDVLRKKADDDGIEKLKTLRLDLEHDPVPSSRFHMIVVSMAMHHIAAVDRVLRAFHEMSQPGGKLSIADLDTEAGDFHSSDAESVHHHGFDRGEFAEKLATAGFCGTRFTTAAEFMRPVAGGGEKQFSIFLATAEKPR